MELYRPGVLESADQLDHPSISSSERSTTGIETGFCSALPSVSRRTNFETLFSDIVYGGCQRPLESPKGWRLYPTDTPRHRVQCLPMGSMRPLKRGGLVRPTFRDRPDTTVRVWSRCTHGSAKASPLSAEKSTVSYPDIAVMRDQAEPPDLVQIELRG